MSGAPAGDPEQERLRELARALPYPPTPDLAAGVRRRLGARRRSPRQPAWALATLALFLAALLIVPEVRAGVGRLLRIGAVEIVLTPTPERSEPPLTAVPAAPDATPTRAPRPTPTPISSVLDLAGETTLADARARVRFPIKLPTYPADLGAPDRIFLQSLDGEGVVLAWLDPVEPTRPRLALYQLTSRELATKLQPTILSETTVGGLPALWVEGPHLLQFRNRRQPVPERLVTGRVLLWTRDGMTYRLESSLPLEEAVKIAESLR